MDGLSRVNETKTSDDRISPRLANYAGRIDVGARLTNLRANIESGVTPSREVSMVLTKLDEVILWWRKAVETYQ